MKTNNKTRKVTGIKWQVMHILILMLTLTSSSIIAQNVWGLSSVATADNLDALSSNPAGLGIHRCAQSGFYIDPDNDNKISKDSKFYSMNRSDGFAYSLGYTNGDKLFNPSEFSIGFAGELFNNGYFGFNWNKHHTMNFGLLYRPFNIISLGFTAMADDKFKDVLEYRSGIAIRPFLKHRLTIGLDYISTKDETGTKFEDKFAPFIQTEIVDGVYISANAMFDDLKSNPNEINLTVGFNFGKSGVYSSGTQTEGNPSFGYGFTIDTQKRNSVFKIEDKDKEKYIRMELDGLFIEEKPKTPKINFNLNIIPFAGNTQKGKQLKAWIDDINTFAKDETIDGLIFDLGYVQAGFAKRIEMRNALQEFKDAGKKIIVYTDHGIGNSDYFLISMADEIYTADLTDVNLKGLSMEVQFLRGLLDTLSIVPEVFRVNYDGKSYKTAGDPFLNRKMSDEMRENYGDLLDDLYEIFLNGVADRFDGDLAKTQSVIDNGPYFTVEDSKEAGLIDSVMYPDEFDDYINSLNEDNVKIVEYKNIDRSESYITEWTTEEKPKIAVIYAVGGIVSGKSNPGPSGSSQMGDETIREAIKSAREDKSIDAIVLRIDSGGGSALASDMMWREIIKTTEEDSSNVKPFIASMSDVAASGGYYIACQADKIIADTGTITGSIGVIGIRLNFSQLLERIGINTEGLKRGEHSDFQSGSRLTTEDEYEKIQGAINDVYTKFKQRVVDGRDELNDINELDNIAMGRVWSGKKALDTKLIDELGGLHDAIEIAKAEANIPADTEVEIVEYPKHKQIYFQGSELFDMKTEITELLPKELAKQLEVLDIIPFIENDEIQFILPYQIEIK
ncbi:MAG: signal peptide peptidase SppA [Candidatus Marinimicrobia bacterium]|nr:signal peptide peptidase SppA [Candidatus Neomarinimicrobiota bacterium]MBL7023447.1 signal peptide peptidase SppA [Candidatus Neomarinimicrobiota bacterium]MBL7108804.1 signal peptide peptidase SppA [Candidatus Neomarinimicrobiota bacterium]